MQKEFEKMFFIYERIASELAVFNCLYSEEDSCHRQSICQQTFLRICISLREAFSGSTAFTVSNKYGKGGVVQISTLFGHPYHVAC